MNREEFLNSLENRLQVLNKQERDDILSEYRQHIELRIGSGLSEEAAIQDFGNLDDLAAEILDAYNVDPEYGRKRHIRLFGGEGKKNHFSSTAKEEADQGKRIFQTIGKKVSGAVKRCLTCLKQWAQICCSGFVRKKEMPEETLPAGLEQTEKKNRKEKQGYQWMRSIKRGILWCIKAAGTVFLLLPMAVMDLAGVVCLGILVVLTVLGYPVVGFMVGMFGGVVGCTALFLLVQDILFGHGEKGGNNI